MADVMQVMEVMAQQVMAQPRDSAPKIARQILLVVDGVNHLVTVPLLLRDEPMATLQRYGRIFSGALAFDLWYWEGSRWSINSYPIDNEERLIDMLLYCWRPEQVNWPIIHLIRRQVTQPVRQARSRFIVPSLL